MKHILYIFIFTCYVLPALYGQKIVGTIILTEGWENKLYIQKVEGYTKHTLIDSIRISADGAFEYSFAKRDVTDELYKIVLPPKGGNEHSQVEGHQDNFFLYTTADTSTSVISASADSLFYSIKIANSNSNKRLLVYRDLKRPFYKVSIEIDSAIAKDPANKESITKSGLKKWMSEVYTYRQRLKQVLENESEDYMLLAGLYYSYYANGGQLDSSFTEKILEKIKTNYLLTSNTRKLINSKQNNRLHLILANYKLKSTGLETKYLHTIADTLKQYSIISFWASWCKPCRASNKKYLPAIIKENNLVNLISISIDENKSNWLKANADDNISWGSYWDNTGIIAAALHIQSIPLYVIIDSTNQVIFETNNHYELEKKIVGLLAGIR